MSWFFRISAMLVLVPLAWCGTPERRAEAEYYAAQFAQYYRVPIEFVRSIIQQESGWHPCLVSSKGAAGIMQLMPATAARLGVRNRCDIRDNISGGVRYLAWLMRKFHGDLRLVAAAFYAGEGWIEKRGLRYHNPDVVNYVLQVRSLYQRQPRISQSSGKRRTSIQ
ncbi:MAG TPA: lytic transglycosylase domain-containing protein [Candidatus Angelobacter sp.]|jgi:soluble lytic murein transglycosylase-like protein|nr:lytic transglycosylase domain-containing protein [Candidatus Angelobacter sp.]